MWKAFLPLIRLFLKTPDKGTATSIYLASSPEVEGVTGRYFAERRVSRVAPAANDRESWKKLWEASERLCGM